MISQKTCELAVAGMILRNIEILYSFDVDVTYLRTLELKGIIKTIKKLNEAGTVIRMRSIGDACETVSYESIRDLKRNAPEEALFPDYVKFIKTHIKSDEYVSCFNDAIFSLEHEGDPDAVSAETALRISSFMDGAPGIEMTYSQVFKDAMDRFEKRATTPALQGINTGYGNLDFLIGGLKPGRLYYIGARPSAGKTALMLNIAVNMIKEEIPFGLISIESLIEELGDRYISIVTGISADFVASGEVPKAAQIPVLPTYDENLHIQMPHATISDIEIEIMKMKTKGPLKVLFIDYIQLISGGSFRVRADEVSHVSRSLKKMALRHGVAIVALAQLNRQSDGKRGEMGSFAESSSLEKDADVMITIDHDGEHSFFNVVKARDGKTGTVKIVFHREKLRFTENVTQGAR